MKFITLAYLGGLTSIASATNTPTCRYLPGDKLWPSAVEWRLFNKTVGGRLVETVPLAQACHNQPGPYDAAQCEGLREQWQNPQIHIDSSSSVMAPFFANRSCDPFTDSSIPCTLGNYVSYAVNASNALDVQAAVSFARLRNLRLVIRNTGHDYNGRSTGAGALSVWTHYMTSIKVVNYNDAYHKGPAMTLGAGVQGYEAMAAARARKLVIVGGECSTVGVVGGYTQGGGHSALSTNFGLAADQTLSMDVVTADGRLVTASRSKNSDLYWALSGGGGGNYGVVVSMTVKAYPDAIVSGASLKFFSPPTDKDTFYAAIEKFHELLPAMVDAGTMVVYYFASGFFQIAPITAYNKTKQEVEVILAPFVAALMQLGVEYEVSYTQSATYEDHYDTYFGPLPYGNIQVGIAQYGGRLIPRETITSNLTNFMAAARSIAEDGTTFIGVGTDVSAPASKVSNSVLPAWRKALVHATFTLPWDFNPAKWGLMLELQDQMTNSVMPQMEAVTPNSGAYMNEADFRQPRFEKEFFGENYKKLLSIKQKWDPTSLFWAIKAVGSDSWNVAADGRMCRK